MPDPPAIDVRLESQLALLSTFQSQAHQALFCELREDQVINSFDSGSEGVSNNFAIERRCRRRGSIPRSSSTTAFPRTDVKPAADELNLMPVERSDLAQSKWSSRDLLFIDSSHICRTKGDLPYLLCKVIPALPDGVLVYVHDVSLPTTTQPR